MRGLNKRLAKSEKDFFFIFRLLLLAGFFLFGLFLGQVFSGRIPEATAEELTRYLTDYFYLKEDAGYSGKAFLSALLIYFRYPLLAFLLSFASLGVLLLPLLTIAYGLFLSFSVCCFTAVFGTGGVLLSLAVLGIRCLIALPCYFLVATPALGFSISLASVSLGKGRRTTPIIYDAHWWLRGFLVAAVLLAGVLAESFLTPLFLRLVLARILLS